jgi:hypothetical protein
MNFYWRKGQPLSFTIHPATPRRTLKDATPTSPHDHSGSSEQVCPKEVFTATMAGDSFGKKWLKRLRVGGRNSAESKTRDGTPPQGAIAFSANSCQGTAQPQTLLLLAYNFE